MISCLCHNDFAVISVKLRQDDDFGIVIFAVFYNLSTYAVRIKIVEISQFFPVPCIGAGIISGTSGCLPSHIYFLCCFTAMAVFCTASDEASSFAVSFRIQNAADCAGILIAKNSLKDSRFLCINRKSGDICLYKTYAKNLSSRRRSAYRVCEKSQKK